MTKKNMNYKVDFEIDFKRNNLGGQYIVFEGIDRSGKSDHAENLEKYFINQGKDVVVTKEPSRGGPIGELIHKILVSEIVIPRVALQYLFAADRQVNFETVVIPALKQNKIVISDRCFFSSLAYGLADVDGYDRKNIDLAAFSVLSMYHQFILPDFTFYLKISVDEAVKRLERSDKIKEIYEKREALEKVEKGYEWIINKFSDEIKVINTEKSKEEVDEEIIKTLLL